MRKQRVNKMQTNEGKNIPEKKFTTGGGISATVWQNKGVGSNGEQVSFRTVSFRRVYKDKDGKWQNSSSLRINDLPRASLVLQRAYEYLVLKGAHDSASDSDFSREEIMEDVI